MGFRDNNEVYESSLKKKNLKHISNIMSLFLLM